MDWQTKMNNALDYIEKNLAGEIKPEAAAKIAGCSSWEFQRLFSFVAHISLGEYVRGRRLDLAAKEIQGGEDKITDIGLNYGYDSPAAFSRAFSRQYGVSPSSARGAGITLKPYPRITFQNINEERIENMSEKNDMQAYSERGYYVKENAPVYFTPDLDKTCEWFRDVLGWYGDIAARSEDGTAIYGCVTDYPGELVIAGLAPYRGFHLFRGEPSNGVVGFIMVQGLERFRAFGKFRFAKEIVFHSAEPMTAERFIGIALSQGGVQAALRAGEDLSAELTALEEAAQETIPGDITAVFSYRMVVAVV